MTRAITSSEVVLKALGLESDGIPAKVAGDCTFCGKHIAKGELCVTPDFGPSFMDAVSLASRGSGMVCGDCAVLVTGEGLLATGYGVFHAGGVNPFRKWADIRAFLENPPVAPFVALYSTAKNQHMAWRAVVNHSRELLYIRVGLRDLCIRRQFVLRALGIVEKMGLQVGREPTKTREGLTKSYPTPFIALSSDLKEVLSGALTPTAVENCSKEDIETMHRLNVGELWALRFLVSPGAGLEAPIKTS